MLRAVTPFSILLAVCLLLAAACDSSSVAGKFFDGPAQNQQARMREYSLEDQYAIFRYGNDVIHPPLLELADPIAERGKDVIPYLLRMMEMDSDPEIASRDTLLVLMRMQVLKHYEVRSDTKLMATMQGRIDAIENEDARKLLTSMMNTISE